jgi:hypothetical protein
MEIGRERLQVRELLLAAQVARADDSLDLLRDE